MSKDQGERLIDILKPKSTKHSDADVWWTPNETTAIYQIPIEVRRDPVSLALQRFIANGQREIDSYSEGSEAQLNCKVRLLVELRRRFIPDEPTARLNTKELAGCDNVASDVDDDESSILDKFDDAEDGAEPLDDDGGSREPRLKPLKPLIGTKLRDQVDSDLKREFDLPKSGTIDRPVPVVRAAGLEDADGNFTAPAATIDPVDLGDIYEDEVASKMGIGKTKRPYHDRVSKVLFDSACVKARRKVSPSALTCVRCGSEFEARKGTRYCSANCRKRAHEGK